MATQARSSFKIAKNVRKATNADAYHERYCVRCGAEVSDIGSGPKGAAPVSAIGISQVGSASASPGNDPDTNRPGGKIPR